jgi:hypothetical protein
MYELWNINCKPERDVWVVKYTGLQFIFHNSYITLRLTVCISQLIHYAQAYSLYFTTHTSRSSLQFVFHNSYITLRLAVYISQLIHHAQAYSLYFTTHTLRSGLQFIFHNSYITLRLTVCISLSVMYELWNVNCKPDRNVWVVKYKL